jgi:hypothetical protein
MKDTVCLVLVEDTPLIEEFQRLLVSIDLHLKERKASTGTVVFSDPDMSLLDSKVFKKNRRMSFILGYKDDVFHEGPFIVKGYSPTFSDVGDVELSVSIQDLSHKLNKKKKQRRWVGTVESVVKRIAKNHGLGWKIDSINGVAFDNDFPLIQANTTDAAFMQKLATRFGYVWGIDGPNLYFKKQTDAILDGDQAESEIPILSYRSGERTVVSFSPRIKFSKSGKSLAQMKKMSNINLISEGVGTAVKDLGEFAESLGLDPEDLGIDTGEVAEGITGFLKDSLSGISSDSEQDDEVEVEKERQGTKKKDPKVMVDSKRGRFIYGSGGLPDPDKTVGAESDEINVDTGPGDPSGIATPSNRLDALRKLAAQKIGTTLTVEGTLVPRYHSLRLRPRTRIILSGVGTRLTGTYRVRDVAITFDKDAGLSSNFEVFRRVFKPDARAMMALKKELEEAAVGEGTDKEAPPKASPKSGVQITVDSAKGQFTIGGNRVSAKEALSRVSSVNKVYEVDNVINGYDAE